jgi:hypothetical protein
MSHANLVNQISIEEFTYLKANYMFTKWLERMHRKFPNMSLDHYHMLMNTDVELFTELKKNIGWGDSFMIELTNDTKFRNGGKYRLIDYPEIIVPTQGQIVKIEGVNHVVENYGFLTFDAYPVGDLDSDDECSVEAPPTACQSPRNSE